MFVTRLVYAGPNLTINKKFYDTVFRRDVNGKGQSFGSIYVGTKIRMQMQAELKTGVNSVFSVIRCCSLRYPSIIS